MNVEEAISYNRPIILKLIKNLRTHNEENESPDMRRYSRDCSGCNKEAESERVVCCACGHAFCRECADGKDACPRCNRSTTFVRIIGDERESSRECPICLCKEPIHRGVFNECGHSICCACAWELLIESQATNQPTSCPFCRAVLVLERIWLKEPRK